MLANRQFGEGAEGDIQLGGKSLTCPVAYQEIL